MMSTYPDTGHICPYLVQKWYHMLSLCDCTFQTRVKHIAGKQGDHVREAVVLGRGSVVVHDGLESFDAADGIGRAWSILKV